MYIWPDSATLKEDGSAPAAGAGGNASSFGGGKAGGGLGGPGGAMGGMPMTPKAGEISISRAETAALSALKTEPDEKHGLRRARAESGLTEQQIKMLQRRADHALKQGFTLVGVGAKFTPSPGTPEEPTLVKKTKADAQAVTEALHAQYERSAYSLPKASDFRLPMPSSMGESDGEDTVHSIDQSFLPRKTEFLRMGPVGDAVEETNSQTTMGRLAMANKRRKQRRY